MSKRTPAISVLTANRLHDGIVVFLDAEGAWVEGIDAAAVARSPQQAEALQACGAGDAAANLVVEPYLAEVRERTALSFPGASSGMGLLADLGIAAELTGKKRGRVFAYSRYLEILSEGTEPL